MQFIEDSPHGVILFSLGTVIAFSSLPDHIQRELKDALAEIPQRVLVKYEGEMKDRPKNVMTRKWLPQRDILRKTSNIEFDTKQTKCSLKLCFIYAAPKPKHAWTAALEYFSNGMYIHIHNYRLSNIFWWLYIFCPVSVLTLFRIINTSFPPSLYFTTVLLGGILFSSL